MTSSFDPSVNPAWQSLEALASSVPTIQSAMDDSDWQALSTLSLGPLTVNVGHHRISTKIFDQLIRLLEASPFKALSKKLFGIKTVGPMIEEVSQSAARPSEDVYERVLESKMYELDLM